MNAPRLLLPVGLIAACTNAPAENRSDPEICTYPPRSHAIVLTVLDDADPSPVRLCDAVITVTDGPKTGVLTPYPGTRTCNPSSCYYASAWSDPGHYHLEITHPAYQTNAFDLDVTTDGCEVAAQDRWAYLKARRVDVPAWAVGLFHANLPAVASAVNVRVGPGTDFEWALTGCDFIGGGMGVVDVEPERLVLHALDGNTTFLWPEIGYLTQVDRVILTPAPDGGVTSESPKGIVTWSPGTHCGCGEFTPCGCWDPFSPNRP